MNEISPRVSVRPSTCHEGKVLEPDKPKLSLPSLGAMAASTGIAVRLPDDPSCIGWSGYAVRSSQAEQLHCLPKAERRYVPRADRAVAAQTGSELWR